MGVSSLPSAYLHRVQLLAVRTSHQQLRGFVQGAVPEAVRPLAYDLHQPAKPQQSHAKKSPIIFLHGLFGSKKNNRGISK